jgi:hypothetical protein
MKHTISLVAVTAIVLPAGAGAQDDFGRIKAKVGQHVIATEDGLSVAGVLTDISVSKLTIDNLEIRPAPGLKIQRENRNRIGRSLLIGAAVTGGLGIALSKGNPGLGLYAALPGAFWGGVIGAWSDHYTLLYDSTDYTLRVPQLKLPLSAPTSFEPLEITRLDLKRGQRVWITEGGITLEGSIVDLTRDRILADSHEFDTRASLRIEREGDPIWDGAAIGFGLGLLAGVAGAQGCPSSNHVPSCIMKPAIVTAGIGTLVDALHKGRTTVKLRRVEHR